MGKHRDRTDRVRSKTLPSSPSHSSSSSDFEFTITVSPRKSSAALCPADELFYKGKLLPLHLSPRISMVRTLLLSSPSTSSSSATASASRDSASSTDSSTSSFASDLALLASGIGSSRPSSVADDDSDLLPKKHKKSNYFSLSRFSNVFKKDPKSPQQSGSAPAKTTTTTSTTTAKEMFRKYLKKVKPLYDKLSHSQKQTNNSTTPFCSKPPPVARSAVEPVSVSPKPANNSVNLSQSFSGNLGYPRKSSRRACVASCPSSMRSSPTHSGVLTRTGAAAFYSDSSTMEELQSAIQGAIAHCKNSMVQSSKASTSRSVLVGVSNEI